MVDRDLGKIGNMTLQHVVLLHFLAAENGWIRPWNNNVSSVNLSVADSCQYKIMTHWAGRTLSNNCLGLGELQYRRKNNRQCRVGTSRDLYLLVQVETWYSSLYTTESKQKNNKQG